MRIMGFDYGESKVGVAVSDPLGWTAQGLETIMWKGKTEKLVERIQHFAKEYNIDKIVVGFPKNTNGTIGERGERTLWFIELLSSIVGDIEIIKWNEWLTTSAAKYAMHEMGVKTSKKKQVEDRIAAVYILQGYLDSKK